MPPASFRGRSRDARQVPRPRTAPAPTLLALAARARSALGGDGDDEDDCGGATRELGTGRARSTASRRDQGRARHRRRRPQRQRLQPARQRGPGAGGDGARRRRASPRVASQPTDYVPNLSYFATPGLRPRDRGRLPDGRGARHRRQAVPRHEVRHRRLLRQGDAQGERGERPGACSSRSRRPATSSATSPRSLKEGGFKGERQEHDLVGRRHQDPAGRPLHRRLPGRREGGHPADRVLNGYSNDFVDQAKCKELAARPDRQGLGRRVPGRRRLRPRRARGGRARATSGASASTRTSRATARTSSRPRSRRSTRPSSGHQVGRGRRVRGRRRRGLRRRRGRRRPRHDLARRAAGASSTRSTRRSRPSRPGTVESRRPRSRSHWTRHPPAAARLESPEMRAPRRSSSAASPSASRASSPTTRVDLDVRAGRDPRPARRERRRQVDADERPLRALPAGRGRDPARRQAGPHPLADGRDRRRDRHGAPALHADPGDDGGREHRARRRADASGVAARPRRGGGARARALATATGSRSPRTRGSRTSRSASSSASRSSRRSTATPTS